ncbi:MAG: hypothetical protein R3E58_11860 [Phycisphaerae bacterium]
MDEAGTPFCFTVDGQTKRMEQLQFVTGTTQASSGSTNRAAANTCVINFKPKNAHNCSIVCAYSPL